MDGEAILGDDLQRAAGQPELALERHVSVVHRAGVDVAFDALGCQLTAQQLEGVGLDQHLAVEVLDPVACRARVTIDAVMLAPPLYRFMVYLMPNQGSGCAVELNNVLAWISRTFMLIVLPLGQTVFPPASSTLAPQVPVAPERRPPPLADGGADQHSLMAHGEQGVAAGRVKQGIQRPRGGTLRSVSYTHLTLPTIYSV